MEDELIGGLKLPMNQPRLWLALCLTVAPGQWHLLPAPAAETAESERQRCETDRPPVADATAGESPATDEAGAAAGATQSLLAELAPDQVVAQAEQTNLTATPIPPVVTGTVDLEEASHQSRESEKGTAYRVARDLHGNEHHGF